MVIGKNSRFYYSVNPFLIFRFFDQVPKEKDQRLPHNKAGLLSMSLVDRTTKFIITLGKLFFLLLYKN